MLPMIKKEKKLKSGLFRKYFAASFFVILSTLAVTGISLLLLISFLWLEENEKTLKENTNYIAENTVNIMRSDFADAGKENKNAYRMICSSLNTVSKAIESDIFITDLNGNVIYCCDRMDNDLKLNDDECRHSSYTISDEILEKIKSGEGFESKLCDLDASLVNKSIVVARPIIANDKIIGAVIGTRSFSRSLGVYAVTILEMFFIAALLAIFVSFLIVYFLSMRLTRPLREMGNAARHYAAGDYSVTISQRKGKRVFYGHDEIDELIDAFNSMAHSLELAENSRRSFVSNVSHELKTPMTSISGFVDGILDGTISEEKSRVYLEIVSKEVKRLSRLVVGMLNMSKLEAGEMSPNPESFDISQMLFVTLLSFEQSIESRKLDIRGLDSIAPNIIYADKDMINQVVYNLIDNAVKFTPDGGYIELSCRRDTEKITFAIKNSGKGIPAGEIDKIFDRFYKIDKSRSFDVKGAGMGLFIVKTIIELHAGRIVCQSVEGEYTEFIFNLPLNE